MSAHNYLNNKQLSMFLPARELMDYTAGHTEGFSGEYSKMSQSPTLYRQKLQESKQPRRFGNKRVESLYESIQKEGVNTPIRLRMHQGTEQINDGHHRLAAANDINPEMYLPISYDS
jgi:uncharacterized protein (DUF1015 family)